MNQSLNLNVINYRHILFKSIEALAKIEKLALKLELGELATELAQKRGKLINNNFAIEPINKFTLHSKDIITWKDIANSIFYSSQTILKIIDTKKSELIQRKQILKDHYDSLINELTIKEKRYRKNFTTLNLEKIIDIQEQKIEQAVAWERARTLIESEQKKLDKTVSVVNTLVAEINKIGQQIKAATGHVCHNCDRLNKSQANFCIYCGTKLVCTNCGLKLTAKLNCGCQRKNS